MRSGCATCGAPAPDAWLCRRCVDELVDRLHGVGALCDDLEITLARCARIGDPAHLAFGAVERPLPLHWGAAEAATALDRVLLAWACTLADDHGVPFAVPALHRAVDPRDPARILPARGRAVAVAAWLAEHADWIAAHHEAGAANAEITDATRRARRVVDRAPALAYAGPCQEPLPGPPGDEPVHCDADIYHRRGTRVARCPQCGAEHDMVSRREWLLAAAQDQLLTAAEASRALPGLLGRAVTESAIRGLVHRGRLAQHPAIPGVGLDARGRPRPTYRVGDLLDALVAAAGEQPARHSC